MRHLWSDWSFLRKGVIGAPGSRTALAQAMGTAAQTTSTSSPVHGDVVGGFSTSVNTSPAFYVVPTPDHPRQPVFVYKSITPGPPPAWPSGATFPGGTKYPAAQQAFCASVPVPLGPNGGAFEVAYGKVLCDATSDRHLTIYDPWHDELWDFEKFTANNTGATVPKLPVTGWLPPTGYPVPADGFYYACDQPGYIGPLLGTSVANGDGIMRGAPSKLTLPDGSAPTVTGSGLCLMAGTISLDDQMSGEIDHMLEVSIACGSGHIAPAWMDDVTPARSLLSSATAGTHKDLSLATPEGAIYRIPASWQLPPVGDKISAHPELAQTGLGTAVNQIVTPWHQMIWKAMRDYGLIVGDFGSSTLQVAATNALDTPYCAYSSAQWNANRTLLNPPGGGSPGNPYGTAPWSLLEQVQWPL